MARNYNAFSEMVRNPLKPGTGRAVKSKVVFKAKQLQKWCSSNPMKDKKIDSLETFLSRGSEAAGYGAAAAGASAMFGGAGMTGSVTTGALGLGLGIGTALTGPGAAVILGAVGLGLLARSMYSNVEKTHVALSPFVWQFTDATAPQKLTSDAVEHAWDLVGSSGYRDKFDQSGRKLGEAFEAFHAWVGEIRKLNGVIAAFREQVREETPSFNKDKTATRDQATKVVIKTILIQAAYKTLHVDKLTYKKGEPAAAELMRRLNHHANYLQAPLIVGLGTLASAEGKKLPALDKKTIQAAFKPVWEYFEELDELLELTEENYEAMDKEVLAITKAVVKLVD